LVSVLVFEKNKKVTPGFLRCYKKIVFVNHIVDDKKEAEHAGPRAKQQAKEKLLQLIEQIENSKNR